MFKGCISHKILFIVNGITIGVLHSKFSVDELDSIFDEEDCADINMFEYEGEDSE